MQMVKWFQSGAGCRKDRACRHWGCWERKGGRDKGQSFSALSAQSPGQAHSVITTWQSSSFFFFLLAHLHGSSVSHLFTSFSKLSSLCESVSCFWFTGRHPHCHPTGGWTLDWSQDRGQSWNLPSAIYWGEFPVFSFTFYLRCLNVGCGLFSAIKFDTCLFGSLVV